MKTAAFLQAFAVFLDVVQLSKGIEFDSLQTEKILRPIASLCQRFSSKPTKIWKISQKISLDRVAGWQKYDYQNLYLLIAATTVCKGEKTCFVPTAAIKMRMARNFVQVAEQVLETRNRRRQSMRMLLWRSSPGRKYPTCRPVCRGRPQGCLPADRFWYLTVFQQLWRKLK